jgi:hypothetical protein
VARTVALIAGVTWIRRHNGDVTLERFPRIVMFNSRKAVRLQMGAGILGITGAQAAIHRLRDNPGVGQLLKNSTRAVPRVYRHDIAVAVSDYPAIDEPRFF